MIRWSYVLPRIALAVVLVLAAKYGVPWLLKCSAIRVIQSTTGAVASVDHVWFSPLRGKVRVDGVRIARRAASHANLVEYRSAILAMNVSALTRRRTVIERAEIHGLSFGTIRSEDTVQSDAEPWDSDPSGRWSGIGSQLGQQWWQSVASGLQSHVEDQFASVRLARELSQRWPKQYDELDQEIIRCKQLAEQFHSKLTKMPDILRSGGVNVLQDTRRQGTALQAQIEQLRQRVKSLQTEMTNDRVALQDALARDRSQIRAKLRVVQLDDDRLSNSLLAGEIRIWLDQVRPWFEVAHWLLAQPNASAPRQRGVFIPLVRNDDPNGLFVRYAELDGRVDVRGCSMPFQGQTRNLYLSLQEPACFHFQVGKDRSTTVAMVFERAENDIRQSITINARHIPTAAHTWGSTDGLALSINPAVADVQLSVLSENNQIDGQLQIAATRLQLVPVVAHGPNAEELQRQLAAALADLNSFVLTARVHGAIDHPRIEIQSNLGPKLRQRVNRVFQQTLDAYADRLAQQAEQSIARQFNQLQGELSRRQADLLEQLDVGHELVTSITKPKLTARAGWQRLLVR